MSMLGLNKVEKIEYNVTESVNLFDGSVEELIEESATAIHGIFEAMYAMDVTELEHVNECIAMESTVDQEAVFEAAMSEKLQGLKASMKNAVQVMATAVMKVINGAMDILKKLKKTNADWLKAYTKGKTANAQSAKVSGFEFPKMGQGMTAMDLHEAFNAFNAVFGASGPKELCFNEGEEAMAKFNDKKALGVKNALAELCGSSAPVEPANFKQAAREAAFGANEPKEVEMKLAEAEQMLSKDIDAELSALKAAKSGASKAFADISKKLAEMDSSFGGNSEEGKKAPCAQVAKGYAACYNVVKSYYINRIKVGVQAANAASAQCKKVVAKCYGKAEEKKEEAK